MPPDSSVQVMGKLGHSSGPPLVQSFPGNVNLLCFCASQAPVGESLETEEQRGQVGAWRRNAAVNEHGTFYHSCG